MVKKVVVKIPERTPGATHRFDPVEIVIQVGDTVQWISDDNEFHTVTPDQDTAFPGADLEGKGATHSHTFNAAGEYPYHCDVHLSMKGVIKVS